MYIYIYTYTFVFNSTSPSVATLIRCYRLGENGFAYMNVLLHSHRICFSWHDRFRYPQVA